MNGSEKGEKDNGAVPGKSEFLLIGIEITIARTVDSLLPRQKTLSLGNFSEAVSWRDAKRPDMRESLDL